MTSQANQQPIAGSLILITRRFTLTRLWPMWTVFTAVGFVVGLWLSSAFESVAFTWSLARLDPRLAFWLGRLAYAFGNGLALGSAQGLVVYYLPGPRRARPWGVFTGVGVTIGIGLQSVQEAIALPGFQLILLILPGLTLGVAQWLMLRKQAINAWAWIVMSVFSWPVGAVAAELVRGFLGLVLAGTAFGVLTGLTLALLLTQQDAKASSDFADISDH